MIPATHADRELRSGGRWSTPTLLDTLLRLAALERAAVHVVAGWVPKVPELDDKLALASGLEEHMGRAIALRQHALALLERDETGLTALWAWIEPLHALDASCSVGGTIDNATDDAVVSLVIEGLLHDVPRFLLARYRDLTSSLDPLYDTRTLATVAGAINALRSDTSAIGTPVRRASIDSDGDGGLRAALEAAWVIDDGPRVALADLMWAPLDRVPVPARPASRPRPVPGVRVHYRQGSRLEARDIAGELNDNVMAELCALELLCRSSYEHPQQSWSSHLAMLRHGTDEARHAAIFRRLMAQQGLDETHLVRHGANYEYGYEFPECEVGSERELVWRLLILCTVLEALAIDKLPVEIAGRDFVGQAEFARALDYIATDELFHAENGLRLTRRLCDELNLDPILERERVHGRFFGRQRDIRQAYLDEDPERAAREIAILEAPDPDGVPFVSRTEVELRLRSSFTIDECDQVERWGYNPVRHELLDAERDPIR